MLLISKIQKILCIKPRGIGDIVLATVVLENLKNAFPQAEIHFLTEDFGKRAIENNPFISKVLTYQKNDFILSIIRKVRKEKYDIVFDFWSNPKTAQITFLSGAKYKIGFDYRGRKYAYAIRAERAAPEMHAAEANFQLLKAAGIPVTSKNTHFYLTEEEKKFAAEYFHSKNLTNTIVIGIIPSGGWPSKRCEPEKWIEICRELERVYQSRFLILWGPEDKEDADKIFSSLKEISIYAPETSVGMMAALISKCQLVIANDSGPMHISAALKVPTIGIFGPTNPQNHRPYSVNSDFVIKSDLFCIICNKLTCQYHHECMFELPVQPFIEKAGKLLGRR
ncbi:MAG: glycosyltransferase family 9 protein [Bacteroidetes bacterium]|nr:glycosyltransferase family 9 protein [Bacteroidota bacterium]